MDEVREARWTRAAGEEAVRRLPPPARAATLQSHVEPSAV